MKASNNQNNLAIKSYPNAGDGFIFRDEDPTSDFRRRLLIMRDDPAPLCRVMSSRYRWRGRQAASVFQLVGRLAGPIRAAPDCRPADRAARVVTFPAPPAPPRTPTCRTAGVTDRPPSHPTPGLLASPPVRPAPPRMTSCPPSHTAPLTSPDTPSPVRPRTLAIPA